MKVLGHTPAPLYTCLPYLFVYIVAATTTVSFKVSCMNALRALLFSSETYNNFSGACLEKVSYKKFPLRNFNLRSFKDGNFPNYGMYKKSANKSKKRLN